MGHSAATHYHALEATPRSVGCGAALLPRISLKAIARCFRKEEKAAAAKKGKRNSISARNAPCFLEIDSTFADPLDSRSIAASESEKQPSFSIEICSSAASQNVEEVQTSTLINDETWAVTRRQFTENAHRDEKDAAQQTAMESKLARSEQENWVWGPPPWQM